MRHKPKKAGESHGPDNLKTSAVRKPWSWQLSPIDY